MGRWKGCLWIDLDERVVDSQNTREDSQTVVVGGSRTIPAVHNFAKTRLRRTASDHSQSFFGMNWLTIQRNSSDLGKGCYRKNRLFTICSGNAPISTGACPGIGKSRTVLILCRYEVFSHLRPSYITPFSKKSGVCTSRHGNDFRESIACFHAAVLMRASCPTTLLDP